jgi:predicted phosphodiesterase
MRIAVLSDIHGNRHAFEAVLADVREAAVDEVWCLGDLVGYGAEPDACVELAERHCAVCLAGNHDLGVIGVLSLEDFSRGARIAAEWTAETISEETREFLLALTPEGEAQGYGLFHASPRDPIWEYVISGLTAEMCFDATDFRVSFIGHSHVALSFHRPDGEPTTGSTRREGDELELTTGHWLINPGGAGQPRDGDPRAAWLLLDTDRQTARWCRTEYDISAAQAAIRAARLPDSLAERLQYGQ